MTNILHQEYKKILDKQGFISNEDLKPLEEILDKFDCVWIEMSEFLVQFTDGL